MAYTIDPANQRIILDSVSVTAQSIYAAWVDWVGVADNAKYLPAFSSAGGDDLGSGLSIPPYYFLENGWRVRPMEAHQNLTITGNLFVRGGGIPVVSTLGTYQVNVNYTVPVQAQGISTSGSTGPTSSDIADAVWSKMIEAGFSADQMLRITAAALAGTTQKAGNTITFKGIDGTTDRIVGSFDVENNRTGAVLDGT